jgi:hypothetical protein
VGGKSGPVWRGAVGASLVDQGGSCVPCRAVSGARTGTRGAVACSSSGTLNPVKLTLAASPCIISLSNTEIIVSYMKYNNNLI